MAIRRQAPKCNEKRRGATRLESGVMGNSAGSLKGNPRVIKANLHPTRHRAKWDFLSCRWPCFNLAPSIGMSFQTGG